MRKNKLKRFFNSLDYWEAINLLSTIIKAQNPAMKPEDVYGEATALFSDQDKVMFLLEETLHTTPSL